MSKRPYRRKSDPPTFVCEKCGADSPRTYHSNSRGSGSFDYAQRFCSKACANRSRPQKTWADKHGYPQTTTPDGRQIAMHRHVMEQKLGRRLLPSETVHHKDGDRTNYAESNLELWTGRHGRGQRASDLAHITASAMAVCALSMGA